MQQLGMTVLGLLASTGISIAGGPVIEIPPSPLPDEAFFASNPDATVNVNSGGAFTAGEMGDPFAFNGATINAYAGSELGFSTIDQFLEDCTLNLEGGKLVRTKLIGSVGSTIVNINSGTVESGLWLMGNTDCTLSDGLIGLVAGGQAALIAEDEVSFAIKGGTIDTFVVCSDDSTFEMTAGTIDGALQLNDNVIAKISGGSVGQDGFMKGAGNVLFFSGGTTDRAFVIEKGVVNLSGGAFGTNSAMLNSSGVDPVLNMTGGALGPEFRAYDGTLNVTGGLIGDEFRLGRPTGDGSGVTMNLVVKSATIDDVELTLSSVPTVITTRGGAFLRCVMLDDSIIGLQLNEDSVFGEDRVRAGATLTIAADCPADLNGDGMLNFFDATAFIVAYSAMNPLADFTGDGLFNFFDVTAFLKSYLEGCP